MDAAARSRSILSTLQSVRLRSEKWRCGNGGITLCLPLQMSCCLPDLLLSTRICSAVQICVGHWLWTYCSMERIQQLRREYLQARREGAAPAYEEVEAQRRGPEYDPHRQRGPLRQDVPPSPTVPPRAPRYDTMNRGGYRNTSPERYAYGEARHSDPRQKNPMTAAV
ncbi:putative partitioning defective 3-like protein B-like [Triplophysa rosa]|uniref:Partitioning defective 3-like protein B-like n=1 Tax=Triplophysa rosa TaxID=992332 RepID=A0A9W7WVH4_TRIRA|nr:putative partitioning defective 3-like protein B-like [Triplophysa rosa]